MQRGRSYKNAVYEQFAVVGKALCSAPRLQILDILQQAERTVQLMARRSSMDELTERTRAADKVLVF